MEKWWVFITGVIGLAISIFYDQVILDYVMNNLMIGFMLLITYLGSFYGVLFLGFLVYLYDKRWRLLFVYILSLVSATLIGQGLKYLVLRGRPAVDSLILKSTPSFPSAHAIAVFSVLPLIIKKHPKLKSWWVVFAFLVILSRIFLGVHYPSDVFAGMLIGVAAGYIVLYLKDEN